MSVDLQINIAVGRGTCMWVVASFKCLSGVYLVSVFGSLSSRTNITKLSAVCTWLRMSYSSAYVCIRILVGGRGEGEDEMNGCLFMASGRWMKGRTTISSPFQNCVNDQ